MITFFPDFNIDDDNLTYEKLKDKFLENKEEFNYDKNKIKGEFIFVVDRSGSMEGQRMYMTKDVLGKLIKLLPRNSYVNILSFGSTHE